MEFRPYSKAQQLAGHQKKEKDTPKYKEQRYKKKKKKAPRKKIKIAKSNMPSMKMRKKFSAHVIEKAIQKFNGLCANCQRVEPDDPHHIRRRSDGGKGVFTNCLPVCRPCHNEIERNAELRQAWKEWAKKEYGFDYWMDEWDKESLKQMRMKDVSHQNNITVNSEIEQENECTD